MGGGQGIFQGGGRGGARPFSRSMEGGQTIFQGIISALRYIERDVPNASVRTTSLLPLLNRYFSSTLVSV